MPPSLATYLTLAFIAVLFIRDIRGRPNITGALWLPFFWIVVGPGSRFLSQWLAIFGLHIGGITVEDGSPIDAAFYSALIAAGMLVLYKRRVSVGAFVRNNRWLTIYLAYCLMAVLWSDFPYVSLKRWIKLLGDPVMALVILTEPDIIESLTVLIKRAAYVILPVSILFIKYFPPLGRLYDTWTGGQMNTGIATNKNELGFDCWIIGAVLLWHMAHVFRWEPGRAKRNEMMLCGGLIVMNLWLLKMAHSASPLVALALGTAIVLFLGFRWVQKERVSAYILAAVIIGTVAGSGLGLFGGFIHLLGRNETFTGRTDIWTMLWNWNINPATGTGFEGFWLGDRRAAVQDLYPGLNEAHNGYLETYLNLGIIGVAITAAMLLATYGKCRRELFHNFEWGRFRMAYLFSFIVYNWTEAAFRLNAFPFFMFFLIAMDHRPLRSAVLVTANGPEEEIIRGSSAPNIAWS
jgi:exopolysaccharide production protein ExoQ